MLDRVEWFTSQHGFFSFLESWPVKMGPTRPETSVNNYHTTPCNYPEDHRLQHGVTYQKIWIFIATVGTPIICVVWLLWYVIALQDLTASEVNLNSISGYCCPQELDTSCVCCVKKMDFIRRRWRWCRKIDRTSSWGTFATFYFWNWGPRGLLLPHRQKQRNNLNAETLSCRKITFCHNVKRKSPSTFSLIHRTLTNEITLHYTGSVFYILSESAVTSCCSCDAYDN
jgi:hypothetical protein